MKREKVKGNMKGIEDKHTHGFCKQLQITKARLRTVPALYHKIMTPPPIPFDGCSVALPKPFDRQFMALKNM